MDLIFSASILAAFLAGMVALFAPCCITVLLPAYLASALKEKRNILKMTFVFFIGMAAILLPISLGAAGLARLFQNFHQQLWIAGGFLMVILAILAFIGKGIALMPRPKRTTLKIEAGDSKSVFLLGLFSGAATSCCAPVLVGAITLAVVSGVFWKALVVSFAYIFGMTFPLFIAAYFYDKFKIENSRFIKGKLFKIKLGAKTVFVHSTNLLAGFVFLIMGITLLIMAFSGNAFWAPSYQVKIGNSLNLWSKSALEILSNIPDFILGLIIISVFFFLLRIVLKRRS